MVELDTGVAMPTSSTIALTTTRDLKHVTGPEDLPPSVARDIAVIVSTYRVTAPDFARDMLKLGVTTGAVVAVALMVFGVPSAVGAAVGFFMALPMLWQKAPLARAQQHLKELGIGWNARRRLATKLSAIVGSLPARDPAERPGADEIVALLAPGGIDPWAPSTAPTPRVLVTANTLDATLANSVVAHTLQRQQRERGIILMFGVMSVGMTALTIGRGAPWWVGAIIVATIAVSMGIGFALGRVMNKKIVGRMLATLGVAPAEHTRIIAALKPLMKRKALADIPTARRREVLTARLVQALSSSPPSSPSSSPSPSLRDASTSSASIM